MSVSRRDLFKLGSVAVAATAVASASNIVPIVAQDATLKSLTNTDPILHLVNRITWGATPEELAHAHQLGYKAYLEEQLYPESIADPERDAILYNNPILRMDRNNLHRFGEQQYRIHRALVAGTVELATQSRRQLHERMVDFWFDHFNVHITEEDATAPEGLLYIRDAIRPNALGNFRTLVLETAKSPAMLHYLDNDSNDAENPNENYARELMELHTLGVDGGYTEQDVVEVARAFTGWTTHPSTHDGFFFSDEMHDYNPKTVLGHNLPAGRGVEDGLQVINILVSHPATAQFLSRKLCVRFVSDNPPQSLIDSTAQVWMQFSGEIRPVLRHIFMSSEFMASTGQKFRRPLEFFVGMLRVLDARLARPEMVFEMLEMLNHIPFNWPPPNGYPDVAGAWLNTNGLLKRWNLAADFTNFYTLEEPAAYMDLLRGTESAQTVNDLIEAVSHRVFGTKLSSEEAAPFISFVSEMRDGNMPLTVGLRAQKLAPLYALMLASPFYQWR